MSFFLVRNTDVMSRSVISTGGPMIFSVVFACYFMTDVHCKWAFHIRNHYCVPRKKKSEGYYGFVIAAAVEIYLSPNGSGKYRKPAQTVQTR